jgi:hypothetical protein
MEFHTRAHYFSGNTRHNRVGKNIFRHDRPGPNHASSPDTDSVENNGVGSDPDIILDLDAASCARALLQNGKVRVVKNMIGGKYGNKGRHHDGVTNGYASLSVDNRVLVDAGFIPNRDGSGRRQEHDACPDNGLIPEGNAATASNECPRVNFDISADVELFIP